MGEPFDFETPPFGMSKEEWEASSERISKKMHEAFQQYLKDKILGRST